MKNLTIPRDKSHYFRVNGSKLFTILVSTAPNFPQFWRQWLQTFHYFCVKGAFKYYIIRLGGGDLNQNDDFDDGTISAKNKKAAAIIYYPLLMIFLMKVRLYISTN